MGRQDDDEIVYVRDEGGAGVKWFVAGAAVGGILALLFAPHSGKKTRKLISRKARDLRDLADEGLDELGDRFEEGKERVREEAGRVREAIHAKVDDVRGRAADTAEAVRGAGATAREELERRLADARGRRRAAALADDEEPVI
ncbi:MAG TPA: YtxH domain-containing protein [Gemmatimonadales bacterium]|nr:YtxH domain-containing protein [Gemmatimonadales bacterium]